MRVGLICKENNKTILMELLSSRDITVDENSDIYIIEDGFQLPTGKISICFELSSLSLLVELMDKLSKEEKNTTSNTIVGKSSDENYEIIPYKRVCFFESRGNNTFCITKEGDFKIREKLYELDTKLPKSNFVRVGKSFIVNIENVRQIIPWFGRRLVLKFNDSKKEVEVSKNYTKSFKEFLNM